jgi:hypothetical protein
MSLPNDLPGQVLHVFESSRQRDVLVNLAQKLAALAANVAYLAEKVDFLLKANAAKAAEVHASPKKPVSSRGTEDGV